MAARFLPRQPAKTPGAAKSRLDKLGVKPGSRVVVLGIEEKSFWRELKARTSEVIKGRLKKDADLIFLLA